VWKKIAMHDFPLPFLLESRVKLNYFYKAICKKNILVLHWSNPYLADI
jgi:hypothetical protein